MARELILIVDDEEGIRESLSDILEDEGYAVLTSPSAEDALAVDKGNSPDIIFLDVWLPGMDGLDALSEFKKLYNNIPIIMISGHGNIDIAVKATKLGAYDFLEKPLSLEKVLIIVDRALEYKRLSDENRSFWLNTVSKSGLIGDSKQIQNVRKQIEMAALSSSRVLILGESGTGKELAARLLHEKSPRSQCPFVEVNCAAIPQELIESELFGHEKGSFTGASERKKGKFELADKGTLFLDEIGDMTLQTQSKVLRVIETQMFQRVGGSDNINVDVRIVAATNKNLVEEVRRGAFREDLYFRLNVIPITLPPLRERLEDIPTLTQYFIESLSSQNGIKSKVISSDGIEEFKRYDWPGNIRELRNVIERLLIMTKSDIISARHMTAFGLFGFDAAFAGNAYFSCSTMKHARELFERDFIISKLKENNWNISQTADLIGVERSGLHKKIKAYNITQNE